MFAAGLQLLAGAAELSGLTCPSLGRGLVGAGGARSCLAAPVCGKVFLAGEVRDGLFLLSAPSRMSTPGVLLTLPASSLCQKTIRVVAKVGSTGTGHRSPSPQGVFRKHHLPVIRESGGGWDYSLPSPFSFQTR